MCDACQLSKKTGLPFAHSSSISAEFYELIHSDLLGPAPINLYDGYKCIVLFFDDRSYATWLYFLKSKMRCFLFLRNFIIW